MKKNVKIFTGLLSSLLVFSLFGCGDGKTQLGGKDNWCGKSDWMSVGTALPTQNAELPAEGKDHGSVAVHDPSVFYDEDSQTYYAFGTHFAVASSKDLITWKQEANDNEAVKLYGTNNWRDVLTESVKHAGKGSASTWAPDVMKIGDQYYMYYSLTAGFGSNKSVIGRVSSDDVMGPYDDEEIIVCSMGGKSEPNCIDPELFYDKEGRLWMVYGSFFSGIYIRELHASGEKAGLPIEGDEFEYGKLLWAGIGSGVEGPFIFYNAELDYYYLMVSDGSLSTDYNMRVARSKNPDGPYEDIDGTDMTKATKNSNSGNKLAGNYQFAGDKGYAALGHNSVIKRDGKYLVVYHTRYRNGTDGVTGNHNLQVNQLYFNEEGWPVMSPTRYVGEKRGLVTQEQAAGAYDVVVHTTTTAVGFADSVKYTFSADGKITDAKGESAGTWSVSQNYYVTLTIGDVEYKGVIVPGWREYGTAKGVYSFTATSAKGGAVWGIAN